MKCNNCGLEYEDSLNTCPNCSGEQQVEVISLNPAANIVSAAIKDGLFLVMCILMSASCVFGILADSVRLFNILLAIFMWLAYAQARKGLLDSTHLRSLSGTTFAMYVINYVGAGLVALSGVILSFVLGALVQEPIALEEVAGLLETENPIIAKYITSLIANFGGFIGFIIIIIAVLSIVLNIFSYGKIHKFAKSVYQSIDMNTIGFQNVKVAKVWLYILGVFIAVSAVLNMEGLTFSDFSILATEFCTALSAIFAAVLIGKYLEEKN
ncbi:MAG: hypothetical protein IJD45_01490 [Clostridia bacterium]|nr:hypothetical protein [Clostridia bacterium]